MNRREFTKKSLIASTTIALGAISSSNAFNEILTQQKFYFMSKDHPNTILIHEFFTAYANNDLAGIKKVLAVDIKWHIPGDHPLSGTKNGIDEVLEFFKKLTIGKFKAEPIIMGVNDYYVIDCHKNWSNIENADNLNAMSCLLWRIENQQIKEVYNFPQDQGIVNTFFNNLFR
jgi:ketosteroid isomerase-like protein